MGKEQPLLVFFDHVFKCAGTTTADVLRRSMDRHYAVASVHSWSSLARQLDDDLRAGLDVAVSGHYTWGLERYVAAPHRLFRFTILRDPFTLACSTFTYRNNIQHGLETNLDVFLLSHSYSTITSQLGDRGVEHAKRRLEQYDFIGFVESYNRDMALLFERLGRAEPAPVRKKNVSARRALPSPWVEEAVRTSGGADFEVYAHAASLATGRPAGAAARVEDSGLASFTKSDENIAAYISDGEYARAKDALSKSASINDIQVLGSRLGGVVDARLIADSIAAQGESALAYLPPKSISRAHYSQVEGLLADVEVWAGENPPLLVVDKCQEIRTTLASWATPGISQDEVASSAKVEQYLSAAKAHADKGGAQVAMLLQRVLRGCGRNWEAYEVLRNRCAPAEEADMTYCNELAATGYEANGYRSTVADTVACRATLSQRWSRANLEALFMAGKYEVRFNRPQGKRYLVARFGPMFAVHDFLQHFGAEQGNGLLVQRGSAVDDLPRVGAVHFLEPGVLNPNTAELPEEAFLAGLEPVIVCSSMQSVNNLHNVYALMRRCGFARVDVYPSTNFFLDDKFLLRVSLT